MQAGNSEQPGLILSRLGPSGRWEGQQEKLSGPWSQQDAHIAGLGATEETVLILTQTKEGIDLSQLALQQSDEAEGEAPEAAKSAKSTPPGPHPESRLVPVCLPPSLARAAASHIVSLVCGKAHVALLDAGGTLWTFGAGGHGQLGHGDMETLAVPRCVRRKGKHGTGAEARAGETRWHISFTLILSFPKKSRGSSHGAASVGGGLRRLAHPRSNLRRGCLHSGLEQTRATRYVREAPLFKKLFVLIKPHGSSIPHANHFQAGRCSSARMTPPPAMTHRPPASWPWWKR